LYSRPATSREALRLLVTTFMHGVLGWHIILDTWSVESSASSKRHVDIKKNIRLMGFSSDYVMNRV
jgi:hypothetical protein